MSVGLSVGVRLPATCTSMGRVLLAALDPAEARRRIEAAPRRALTARTITDPAALMACLDRVRADGYAVIDQELEIGLVSIAVPVFDRAGRIQAAINVGTHASRFPPQALVSDILPRLKAAQADLSRILG
jgi:IclR family pca regulon transcriptional regulator